jgi:hypothetical protein
MSAVQEEHGLQLERLQADMTSLRRDLPSIVADAVRDALKERG